MARAGLLAATAALSTIGAALGAPLAAGTPGAGNDPSSRLAARLGADSATHVAVRYAVGGRRARFLGGTARHPLARPSGVGAGTAKATAGRAFVRQQASLLGLPSDPQLRVADTAPSPGGGSVVHVQQLVDGLPVISGEVAVALTADNHVAYASGETAPATTLPAPRVSAAQARSVALAVTSRAERVALTRLDAGAATLAAYSPALLTPGATTDTSAVYRVEVTGASGAGPVRELVLVDAVTGTPALHFNQVASGIVQHVCDAGNRPAITDPTCPPSVPRHADQPTQVSNPQTSPIADVQPAFNNAADAYAFYDTFVGHVGELGIKSGTADRALNSTVGFCDPTDTCPMQNAFWDGHEMAYGKGFAGADDVVGHELSHGVTEHLSNLNYWYQSGAINESMSDVMGELMDQSNGKGSDGDTVRWKIGEDLPPSFGVVRDMAHPTVKPAGATKYFTVQPDRISSSLYYAPKQSEHPGDYAYPADNGGVHMNSGVGNKAAYLIVDGATFNGVKVEGLIAHSATRELAIAKAARIYYQADGSLTSGADYLDLAAVLPAACDSLVGKTGPKGDVVTKPDCDTVRAAVKATEMAKPVAKAGATAPEAPQCGTTYRSSLWADDVETPTSGRWKRTGPWSYVTGYATSKTHSLLGKDPVPSSSSRVDGYAAMTRGVTVPAGKTAYVWFAHAYQFEWYTATSTHPAVFTDGGRVEYSTDRGAHWADAGAWFDSSGYNHTIRGYNAALTKEIYRFKGFGGDSHGYISTRLKVPSSLAGKPLRIRFHVTADASVGATGWYVDDVRFFTCGAKPSAPTSVVARPGVGRVGVSWVAPSVRGGSARTGYQVTLKTGTKTLKTVRVGATARSYAFLNTPGGKSLTAYVAAVNAAGAGPSGHSATLSGTTVSLSASPSTVRKGRSVVLSGTLRKAGTGVGLTSRTVTLWRARAGSSAWVQVTSKTVRTGSGGKYRITTAPTRTYQYQTRYAGFTPYQGSRSFARVVHVVS